MIFLDFEASAAMGGFPIEVGFCVVEPDRTMRSAAKLIRHDEWLDDFSRWDWRAQEIHHIDRDQLIEAGEPPQEVMSWLNAELGGMVACCDSHMDGIWLKELADAAGIAPAFGLEDIAAAFEGPEVDDMGYAWALTVKDRVCPKTHRAARDAEHLATWYVLSLRVGANVRAIRAARKTIHKL